MRPIEVCFGMIKVGILFVVGLIVLAIVGPTVGAFGDYLIRPHNLSCNDYSLSIPMNWKLPLKRCDHEVLIERRSDILFDSVSGHQLMFIRSIGKHSFSIDQEQTEFREAHLGKTVSPMEVSSVFNQCLRADEEADGTWVSVSCIDHANRVEITYFGPMGDLNTTVSLVTLRP